MMNSQQINSARVGLHRLQQVIPNLRFAGMKPFEVASLGVTFSWSLDGCTITVEVPWASVIVTATGRPVWNGEDWKMEYLFCFPHGIDVVEVFRVYINDQHRASNKSGQEFGAASGVDFIEYVCESVCEGLLNSPIYSPKPL